MDLTSKKYSTNPFEVILEKKSTKNPSQYKSLANSLASSLFKDVDNRIIEKLSCQLWDSCTAQDSKPQMNSNGIWNSENSQLNSIVDDHNSEKSSSSSSSPSSSSSDKSTSPTITTANDEEIFKIELENNNNNNNNGNSNGNGNEEDDEFDLKSLTDNWLYANNDYETTNNDMNNNNGCNFDVNNNNNNNNEDNLKFDLMNIDYLKDELAKQTSSTVPPEKNNDNKNENQVTNQLCTLYLDMTFDDRLFFGIHNFVILKFLLSKHNCNIDFSSQENKVSISGNSQNVNNISKIFFAHSTFSIQLELFFYDEKILQEFMRNRTEFFKEYQKLDVFINQFRTGKSNTVHLNILTYRKLLMRILDPIRFIEFELEYYQIGKIMPKVTSTLQIPILARRNDPQNPQQKRMNNIFTNSILEKIENEANCQIKVSRSNEFQHQYPFWNVLIMGSDIFSVIKARFLMTSKFQHELKFKISSQQTGKLVNLISSIRYDCSKVEINISPGNVSANGTGDESKIVSIKSNEANSQQIFDLFNRIQHGLKDFKPLEFV